MPTLTFRGGSPAYIDAQGRFHEAKLGPNGYVYKTTSGMWAPVGAGTSVYGPQGGTVAPITPAGGGGGVAAPPAPQRVFRPEDDPAYNAAQIAAYNQREATLASLSQQRTSGLGDYGFQETNIDPTTGVGTPVFDPNNPFSKAALLKQSYDRSRRTSGQTMAAAGQQYAGAFQTQQDYVNRQQLQGEDTLQKSLIRFLAANTQRRKQAGESYQGTVNQAAAEAAARFANNPPQ
jgi:hypothetical protein